MADTQDTTREWQPLFTDKQGGWIERDGPNNYRLHITESHVCGLQGFGYGPDDVCPACRQGRSLRELMRQHEQSEGSPMIPPSERPENRKKEEMMRAPTTEPETVPDQRAGVSAGSET